jgi:hypothetical protein
MRYNLHYNFTILAVQFLGVIILFPVGSECYRIISSSGDIIARFLTVGNS